MPLSYGKFQGLKQGDIIQVKSGYGDRRYDIFIKFFDDEHCYLMFGDPGYRKSYKEIFRVIKRADSICGSCLLKSTCNQLQHIKVCFEKNNVWRKGRWEK